MDKRVAILQSNYIPWKGYFHLIQTVDTFVFLDSVQYTSRDWRNRNQIKSARGKIWLSVPVGSDRDRLISDVQISDQSWQISHYRQIVDAYKKAPFYGYVEELLAETYLEHSWTSLSTLNQALITRISREFLGIKTEFKDSAQYELEATKGQDRLLRILGEESATHYISGPAAKAYIDPIKFQDAGLHLTWMDYPTYKQYDQVHPPFDHHVTILDLLLHTGDRAWDYIWGTASESRGSQ